MLLPLCGLVLAGVPAGWAEAPVAWDLHPVGWNAGVRYQELLDETLGGPRASPVFSPVLAEADVHWRLAATWDDGLRLGEEEADRWRDVALAGALLAGTRLVDETLARQTEVHVAFAAADAVLNPSLQLARGPRGELAVRHRVGGPAASRVARAEAESALDPVGPPGPRPPSVDLGLDWRLREEDDPAGTPFLDYGFFLSTSRIGLDNLRLDLLARAGDWSVTGRTSVYPRVFLVASARSLNADLPPRAPWLDRAAPGRWSAGVMWTVPRPAGWTLRLDRVVALGPPAAVTWQVSVRGEFGAPPAGRPRPALGARDDTPAWLPWVPERAPNEVRGWTRASPTADAPSAAYGAPSSPGTR